MINQVSYVQCVQEDSVAATLWSLHIDEELLRSLTDGIIDELETIPIWSVANLRSGESFLHQLVAAQKHHHLCPHPPPALRRKNHSKTLCKESIIFRQSYKKKG